MVATYKLKNSFDLEKF